MPAANVMRVAVHILLATTVLILVISTVQVESRAGSPFPLGPEWRYDPQVARLRAADDLPADLPAGVVPQPVELARGDTLAGMLGELGLAPGEVYAAVEALGDHLDVRRVQAGESGVAYFDADDRFARLRLRQGDRGWVALERRGDAFVSAFEAFTRSTVRRQAAGTLEATLQDALARAGADPNLAYAMSSVLQWDLDFHRDLRLGDRFQVVWDDLFLDGEPAGAGEIVALVYENRGMRYEAYRWGDGGGYYDADGRPLRKMFLRSPLPFSRVTSRFSQRRFHPVLEVYRPHYGVDYGAPPGTPVHVTANGTVTFVGKNGGAGNMVSVRHANGYETSYLHLSRFATGLRRGHPVRQGDVVGYVGSTGLATGPHLDYRVQLNGGWIDPLRLENRPAEPIPEAEIARFLAERDAMRGLFDAETPAAPASRTQLARAPEPSSDRLGR